MATTGFWPVRGSLKTVLDYAENPDKTINPKYFDSDLYAALLYVGNSNKTDTQYYVSGINCSKSKAYEQMIAIKKKYGDRGSVVAYHGYQSFKGNEVSADECHEIGIETARRMWGDRYQVVVTTHLDKQCHLHNHFVINSTSFKDGLKFRNKIGDHYELRKISDEICKARGKSVIENAPFYRSQKNEYCIHQKGNKTHRDMLKDDVEHCLKYARNWDDFRKILASLGYSIDYSRMTIKAKNWERGVRLSNIGYTFEIIVARLDENLFNPFGFAQWNNYVMSRNKCFALDTVEKQLKFSIKHAKKSDVIFVDTMFLLIVMVLKLFMEVADAMLLSPEMRHAAKDIEQFVADYHFLKDNGIHTTDELKMIISETTQEITRLEAERRYVDNKKRRAKKPSDVQLYKILRKTYTEKLVPLRKKLKQAEKILEKSPHLYELLQDEHRLENNKTRKLERTR